MQVARQLLSLSYWNLQDADAYVALMEIRRSFVLVVSQQPVPGTIGPENVGSWHMAGIFGAAAIATAKEVGRVKTRKQGP